MAEDLIRALRSKGIALLMALSIAGCGGDGSVDERVLGPTFGDRADLITWLTVTPTEFHAGDIVQIEVGTRNPTTRPILLSFADGCGLHYVVEDGSEYPVKAFLCTSEVTSYELAPGKTLAAKYSWDGTGLQGTLLPPGEYWVRSRGVDTTPVTIRILAP